MGVGGNSGLSKSSTDGILNLLQLSLLGNNAGVNVNTSAVPTSTITSLNSGIIPNSNNIMVSKPNFYPQNVAPNLSGLTGVGNIQQSIISQPVSYYHLRNVKFNILSFLSGFFHVTFFELIIWLIPAMYTILDYRITNGPLHLSLLFEQRTDSIQFFLFELKFTVSMHK